MLRSRMPAVVGVLLAGMLALTGCRISGGTTQVDTGDGCTEISVPSIDVSAPSAPTTLPGVVLAPCPTTPPPAPTTELPAPTTASPPPTTSAPPTTAPPTTTTPPPADQTEAAVAFGWGSPLPISDNFAGYTGPPDPAKWEIPDGCWDGHAGNGRRCGKNTTVANGIMTLTGEANGDTGWVRQKLDTQYGRWEIRSRSMNTGASGGLYHPLHLIWPTSERWPADGEYDWLEYFNPDAGCASAFLHYPHAPGAVQQEYAERCPVDMTQWHNFAFEWTPTHVAGFIDGVEWFRYSGGATSSRRNIQDMPQGALTIQLDNFTGDGGLRPAKFEVDWVRFYPVG